MYADDPRCGLPPARFNARYRPEPLIRYIEAQDICGFSTRPQNEMDDTVSQDADNTK